MITFLAGMVLAETPEATVAAFVKAFNENDAAALGRELEGGSVTPSPLNPSHVTIKAAVVKTTISGEDAYLEVDVVASGSGLPAESKSRDTVHLRLRDGGWRIVPPSMMSLPNLSTIAMFASDAPVVQQARSAARSTLCLSNVKQLALATLMYADDHDDTLPKAAAWKGAIMPYAKDERVFHCPDDASGEVSYFLDLRVSGQSLVTIASPAQTALIVEGTPQKTAFRHRGRASLGYLDGHAKQVDAPTMLKARTVPLK